MGDAAFDGEVVGFGAAGPGEELGDGEEGAEDGDYEGGEAAGGGGRRVGGFGLGEGVEGAEVGEGRFLAEGVFVEAMLLEAAEAAVQLSHCGYLLLEERDMQGLVWPLVSSSQMRRLSDMSEIAGGWFVRCFKCQGGIRFGPDCTLH